MKFLTSKHFERHELWNGVSYLAGTQLHTVQLAKLFSDHETPKQGVTPQLCGRAMIIGGLAQTDHLNTYPLWYREDGSVVYSLWSLAGEIERDDISHAMRDPHFMDK